MRPNSLAEKDKGYGCGEDTIHPGILLVNVKTYNNKFLIFSNNCNFCELVDIILYNILYYILYNYLL